ncbi:MAG: hypothetical protein V4668_03505 [Patescibacteria group bacterium]
MLIVVDANPFFDSDLQTDEIERLFFGLRLEVSGPYKDFFPENFYKVSLQEFYTKLNVPQYYQALIIFRTQVCTFTTLAEQPFFDEVARLIEIPIRASACLVTTGAIH